MLRGFRVKRIAFGLCDRDKFRMKKKKKLHLNCCRNFILKIWIAVSRLISRLFICCCLISDFLQRIMGSSGFENLFKIDPQFEECKSLSPLTYYHPFQSSFDPDFGKSVSVDADKSPNSTGGFANRWTNEPVGRKLTGRSYLKSWKEEIPTRSFGTESHIQVPNTSFASFTQNMNSPQRTFSNTLSQPNRSPSDSSLFHPEFLVPDHFNLGQLNTLRIPSTDLRNISPPALDYGSSSSSNFDWKNLFEPSTQALLPAARNSSFAHQTGRKVCQDLQRTGNKRKWKKKKPKTLPAITQSPQSNDR